MDTNNIGVVIQKEVDQAQTAGHSVTISPAESEKQESQVPQLPSEGVEDLSLKTTPQVNSSVESSQSATKPNEPYLHKVPQTAAIPPGPRRSSSRSIKRPKFDDELVDTTAFKRSSSRKTSESSPSEHKVKKVLSKQSSHSTVSTPLQAKKKIKKIKPNPVPIDFGRWRPTDDLTLINAVTQTCDLQMVHHAVRFSCNFTLKEIQDRWFALLYDPLVSRLAQQSIKALPSEVVNQIMKNVLWSKDEECLLADMDIEDKPTLEDFRTCLEENIETFHKSRSAKTLFNHWLLLRHYQLLNCQTARSSSSIPTTIAEMEAKMIDDQLIGPENDVLNQELSYADRCDKREIRQLEKEIPQWEIMLEKSGYVEGLELCDFKKDTLAVLKGRILKYHINTTKALIGRCTTDFTVDVDLSIEGPSSKISRKQGVISFENNQFFLLNCGKRIFYVNGQPLESGKSVYLMNNSVIEIYCIKLLFIVNPSIVSGDVKLGVATDQNMDTTSAQTV